MGSVDSKEDRVVVTFDLPVVKQIDSRGNSKRRRAKATSTRSEFETRTLEINLAQDCTSLRSKRGDTGQYANCMELVMVD